jgi:hypothetical protein
MILNFIILNSSYDIWYFYQSYFLVKPWHQHILNNLIVITYTMHVQGRRASSISYITKTLEQGSALDNCLNERSEMISWKWFPKILHVWHCYITSWFMYGGRVKTSFMGKCNILNTLTCILSNFTSNVKTFWCA